MNNIDTGFMITLILASVSLAAWIGAVLTREDRPLAGLVERHLRVLVVGPLVTKAVVSILANDQNARIAHVLELAIIYLPCSLCRCGAACSEAPNSC
jgi:hypothetical protein